MAPNATGAPGQIGSALSAAVFFGVLLARDLRRRGVDCHGHARSSASTPAGAAA
jgi:hypothetical protein